MRSISWRSKLQSVVTHSTTEAEYIAACSGDQEAMWLRSLFTELGLDFSTTSSPLLIDNMSSINVAKNPEHHGRMKHLDIKHFWLREVVNEGVLRVIHCPTALMPADLLTKALPIAKVQACCEMLGLRG